MGNVVILDENTSNQIAAGEVVERPASVVKELVENSIDAGSTNISIEINNGGISLIKVSDNGSGIQEDDVIIAFERHATSKIRSSDDLENIATLGFRGEALASIASVAAVEVTTRVKDEPYGSYVKIQGGVLKESNQVGCPVGTSFSVRDLFYNTPARYKFLKKDSTEAGYISDIVSRIALSKPQISFKLINNRSTVIHTPGNNDLLSTIFSIYGKEIAKECVKVDYQDEKLKISGFAGKPEIARSNRNNQSIYINGRYVRNKVISSAVDEAYKTYLLKSKFAFIVLNIEINPMLVDVNVHPTKMEVRFSQEQDMFRAVYYAVNSALLSKSLIRNVELPDKQKNYFKFEESSKPQIDYVQQGIEKNYEVLKESKQFKADGKHDQNCTTQTNKVEGSRTPTAFTAIAATDTKADTKADKAVDMTTDKAVDTTTVAVTDTTVSYITKSDMTTTYKNAVNIEVDETELPDDLNAKEAENISPVNERKDDRDMFSNYKIIGQVFLTYILLQNQDKLIVIDQHAAHERIMFENLKRRYREKADLAQYLLSPVVIELTNQEIKIIEDEKDFLKKIGYLFDSFGNNSIILRSVPSTDEGMSIKDTFLEILDFLMKNDKKDNKFIEEEALYKIACKSAVKANKRLDDIEIKKVLEDLMNIENPYTCPHGRPTIIKITKYEFEKMFKRIV